MNNAAALKAPSKLTQIKESLLTLSLLVVPSKYRASVYYNTGSDHNFFTEKSHYLNMGYWKDNPQTMDEACQAMAKLAAEAAQVGPEDRILDAGFGFGDQDIFWMQHFAPQHITGINVTASQVKMARERVADLHLEERIDLRSGSATEMPFEQASFDKVISVESAFHFVTREKFFHEAYRVLRPGGRLVVIDTIPLATQTREVNRLERALYYTFLPTPKENVYLSDTYIQKLEKAGFQNVSVTSIREHVLPPVIHYLSKRLQDPDIVARVSPSVRKTWLNLQKPGTFAHRIVNTLDYIVAVGDKPQG